MTVPEANDEIAIVDSSAATTKKITRADFLKGAALPADTVDTQAIADGAVTDSKWRNNIAFMAVKVSADAQTVTGTASKVNITKETYDISNNYDASNSRFTAPTDGIYSFSAAVYATSPNTGNKANIELRVNGTAALGPSYTSVPATFFTAGISGDLKLDAGDYVEVFISSSGGNITISQSSTETTSFFSGKLITNL